MNWISRFREKTRLNAFMNWTLGCFVGLHSDLSPFKATLNQTSIEPYYTACKKRLMILLRAHFCIYCAGLPLFFYINVLDGHVALVSFMTGYSKNTVERCSTLKGRVNVWMASRCFTFSCSSFAIMILKTATRIFSKTAPFVFHRQNKVTQVENNVRVSKWWLNCKFFGWMYLNFIDPRAFPALSASIYSLCAGWRSRWLHSYSLSV